MAKLARKFQKVFALTNDGSQRFGNGQFGSALLGTKNITNDVETLQNLAAYDNGWEDAVITNSAGQPTLPPLPEMQALNYIETYQLAYLFQEGIPEYNVNTTYFQNSIVKLAGSYQLYGSLVDNNLGNSTSDPTKWALLVDLSAAASTNTTTSVTNELALFSGTGGRTFKRATLTGLVKAASGVASAAVAGVDYLAPGGVGTGRVLSVSTSTATNTAFHIPFDNTPPEITEGAELFSQAITPATSTSTIIIDINIPLIGATTSGTTFTGALFVDATTNAIDSVACGGQSNNTFGSLNMRTILTSGSTTARTYSFRYGAVAGTAHVLADSSGNARYGGVATAYMTITEII